MASQCPRRSLRATAKGMIQNRRQGSDLTLFCNISGAQKDSANSKLNLSCLHSSDTTRIQAQQVPLDKVITLTSKPSHCRVSSHPLCPEFQGRRGRELILIWAICPRRHIDQHRVGWT